ncbi:ABC transporter substrate-binding protein [Streptomyces lydicus]|uniref:ABC transporter substrate-binding protein n=1 Tax=Streptomyces lydicus TaxID=47763 RepID=UPI0036E32FBE
MSTLRTLRRHSSKAISKTLTAVVYTTLLAAASVSCSASDGTKQTTITIGTFGNFGYQGLYRRYEKQHPGIKIEERTSAYADHHTSLAAHLAAGYGANDIEAIETGYIAQFKGEPQRFVNFLDEGVTNRNHQWLDWKWAESLAPDGKSQIGLGTDVGGLAICYRRDMFRQAGLPVDRDAVSRLWLDWKSYFATGRRFLQAEKNGRVKRGTKWFDGGGTVFNAMMGQAPVGYYAHGNKLVVATNPAVKAAWDQVSAAGQEGQSAGLMPLTTDWNDSFARGQFATIPCPAWMTGLIQDRAKSSAGQWDVAAVPSRGGNWGGSFLAVPAQTKHRAQAVALAKWLTQPAQQAYIFRHTGNLPSEPSLYAEPSIVHFKKAFFNNAPLGKIFTKAASDLRPRYEGPKEGDIWLTFGRGLKRVEDGDQTSDQSWRQTLAEVRRVAAGSQP